MKIIYIFRTPSSEKSIERVFDPIMQYMQRQGNNVSKSFAKGWKLWPLSMIYNIIKYSICSYLNKETIFHITGDIQYIACLMNPSNTILTIHDCVTLHNSNAPIWLKKFVYKYWYEKPLKHLKKITCISDATYKDIISFFPWSQNKITVIPNAVGCNFKFIPRDTYNENPIILHIGTRSNKNLERVIQALNKISCKLVIIGVLSKEQRALLKKYVINYKNRFNISDEEILEEYKKADIISFPSLFEGFGMPIIEGQTIGRPVLTSNREPMSSIAGENAMLVDPESIESIRNGFLKLIRNKEYYNEIVKSGLINAKKYNIKIVTDNYLKIYKNIVY